MENKFPCIKDADIVNANIRVIKDKFIWFNGAWHDGTWHDGECHDGEWLGGTR